MTSLGQGMDFESGEMIGFNESKTFEVLSGNQQLFNWDTDLRIVRKINVDVDLILFDFVFFKTVKQPSRQ